MVSFHPGELFKSFSDLTQKLNEYSEATFCHFYIKDSKKLAPDEIVNPNLIYKHIAYSCIYGGQKPRFRGSGSRSVTSIRHGCTASLYLRATKDRTHLQVRNFVDEHNHEISEELFRSASQDKKLPEDLKLEVEELLLLGADKDRLCEYIRYVTKKSLDKKNLFNIYDSAVKQQREISRDRAVMLIQKAYSVDTEEEAEQILQQLLQNQRPKRHSKKPDMESVENVQVTYYNEGDESQGTVDGEGDDAIDQSLQRLMGTLGGHDGERIVIVQQNDEGGPIEVIEADGNTIGEYLEDEDGERVIIKQEMDKGDDETREGNDGPRYLTLKDLSKSFQQRKRPMVKADGGKKTKIINSDFLRNTDDSLIYEEPSNKTRIVSSYGHNEDLVVESDALLEAQLEKIRTENEKLITETEVLKLKKNKIIKDLVKLDSEKNKIQLEVELLRQKKKNEDAKTHSLEMDIESKTLKSEKLRLEIAKLKFELNEN